jgi:hypothetical protein
VAHAARGASLRRLVTTMHRTLTALVLLGSYATAQQPDAPHVPPVATGAFGIGLTTQYFFRGLLQENQGIIAQPWIELGYALYEADADDGLRDLGLTFGLWNSLHDGPTGGAGGIWAESDFDISLAAKVDERWKVGATYTAYSSPNDSLLVKPVQELAFSVGLDDRGMLVDDVDSGLRPTVLIAFELSGQRDFGNDRGVYLQAGIEPTFGIGQLGDLPLTLEVPVTAGFSLGDYYEEVGGGNDEFFGFLDVGAEISAPLSFMPARLGPWTGMVGLHWLLLGDNTEERNNGDTTELILSVGMETIF